MKTSLLKRLFTPDLALVEENCFDEKGQLRMYHPAVQQAMFELIQPRIVELLKEDQAEEKSAKKSK